VGLHRSACRLEELQDEYREMEEQLGWELQQGYFHTPANYGRLLKYLIFLNSMCFDTHTFKTLINNKMLFFRDNNKIKNELLEEKKNIENRLWELKEQ
jgi:hypothetical protein